jgi:hypothetical protein
VVKSGTAAPISVNFNGKAVTTDITAAQIAIWNAGRMPIKRADVLQRVLITLPAAVPILEASIRKVSRNVTNITLDETVPARDQVCVQFDILEQNDGCTIQLIYGGSPDVPITVSSVIIGQHAPKESRYGGRISSPGDQYVQVQRSNRRTGWSMIGMGTLWGLFNLFVLYKGGGQKPRPLHPNRHSAFNNGNPKQYGTGGL